MVFKALKKPEQKVFGIKDFSGGADFSDCRSMLSGKNLSDNLNMIYSNGNITGRPGLYSDSSDVIESHALDYQNIYQYRFIEGKVAVNGNVNDIVGTVRIESDSYYYLYIYFIDCYGNKTNTGSIVFQRYSNDSFYQPQKIVFYNAAPISGGGIFAFVQTEDIYDVKQKSHRMYEISEDLSSWNRITDFYIPTVYINGRGNRYEEAKADLKAFTGQPKVLESMNMLSNRFKSYFTSDGCSSCFRLPFSELSDDSVICRVYSSPTYYTEWVIGANTSSKTEKFYSFDVTLNVDRRKGMIYFTANASDYSIPYTQLYHENNICVTAGKITENSFSGGAFCTSCVTAGSGMFFSGGRDGDRIIGVSPKNPLYFPEDCSCVVGEKGDKITAMIYHKNGIYAFKKNALYSVKTKKGEIINSTSLLADNGTVFYKKDTFEIAKISDSIGCGYDTACTVYNGSPIWLGSDLKVYTLDSSSKIKEISEDVNKAVYNAKGNSYTNGFSAVLGKYYALIFGGKAFIMEYGKDNKPCWYYWDFGNINILGLVNRDTGTKLFCTGSDGNTFYTAKLYGSNDVDIRHERAEESPTVNSKSIAYSLSTVHFDFGSLCAKKILNSILLSLAAEGCVKIYINGKYFDSINFSGREANCGLGALNTVKLIPHMYGVNSVYITLESDKSFTLGEIDINYEKTQN